MHKRGKLAWLAASFLSLTILTVNVVSSAPAENLPPGLPPPIKAILKTSNNRPISVNGATAISGATVLTGSMIETPDQVGAVITLGSVGELELEPNTLLKLEFDENGNMKVTLVRGCTTARTKKNVVAEIDTEQGVAATTDPNKRKNVTVCYPPGSDKPIISIPAGAGAAGGKGWFYGVLIGAISTGVILPILFRGDNPSSAGLSNF